MNQDMFMVHTLSVLLLKISHLIAGILLCFLGKGLFERGIKADFTGEGTISKFKFRLVTSSPGVVFLIAGLAVIISSVMTQTEYVESSGGRKVSSRFMKDEMLGKGSSASNLELSPEASQLLSLITIYTEVHSGDRDDKVKAGMLLKKIPNRRDPGSFDSTRKMLKELFNASPSSLLCLLEDPKYQWILDEAVLVDDLNQQLKQSFNQK